MSQAPARVVAHASANQPFDFNHTLAFLGRFPAMTGEHGLEDGELRCAVREAGTLAGARIRAEGDGLRYELESPAPLTKQDAIALTDRLSFFLGVQDDIASFYALAEGDKAFKPVVRRLYGYHQVKFPSPLELLVWSILGQRCPMPVARKMKHAIVAEFDNRIGIDGQELWAFPDLEQLLQLGVDDYERLIRNARKARYLHGAVEAWARLDEPSLRTGDYDAVREELLRLPGIGPWSASFILIRGLGRMERLEPEREGLRAASKVYGRELSKDQFRQLARRYGRWQGYWGHYLRAGG
jgi:DNA-3-methyladenine glycosylase II